MMDIERISAALRDLTIVDADYDLFGVGHILEVADGGHGPDTVIMLRCGETGEVRQELLSTLRDADAYTLFASAAQAKAWVEKKA